MNRGLKGMAWVAVLALAVASRLAAGQAPLYSPNPYLSGGESAPSTIKRAPAGTLSASPGAKNAIANEERLSNDLPRSASQRAGKRPLGTTEPRDTASSGDAELDRAKEDDQSVKRPPTPFQRFAAESLGQILPVYGEALFESAPTTFAPVDNVPVTPDYVIGPGDEIVIRAWGQIDVDYRATVDRLGTINLPRVGVFNVAGLRYRDLSGYLQNAISRVFKNFELNVSLGQLRSIQVFVVGQAQRPGAYTVSSLTTLVNALFASGGPSPSGTMRAIQLKRGEQVVGELDLYDLLLSGDKSKDVKLLPGDVIHVPPIGPQVAISGAVNVAAIYELRGAATLGEAIALAGGLANVADGQKVSVERIDERRSRSVVEFPLDKNGLGRPLKDGDVVRIFPLSPQFQNAVTLRGAVALPLRYPWKPGMRIRDLIPSKDALIVADYWRRINATPVGGAPNAIRLPTEVRRLFDEINWDYAVIERLDKERLTPRLISFDLGKAVLDGDPGENLALEPGDVVTVFSVNDIAVPVGKRVRYVRLEGEVARPGIYAAMPGETLRQLIARVGGVTGDAYLFGAEFLRHSTKRDQERRLKEALDRMEREFEAEGALRAKNAVSADERGNVVAQLESQRRLLDRLRQVKPTGRVVLDLDPRPNGIKDLPDLPLEDNDRFIVPPRSSTVQILGSVYNENAFIYKPGKTVSDYLAQAGGPTPTAAPANTYVVRADGSVVSRRQSSFFTGFGGETLMPNDTIVVPEATERFSWVKELKDWSQILYQFGLGVAAIKVLKD